MTRGELLCLAAAVGLSAAVGLAAAPKLSIARPTLHTSEDGPAIPAAYEYIPGELVYLSFRIAGFQSKKDVVEVRYQIVMTDPDGVLVVPPISGSIEAEVNDNDKDWMPKASQIIPLPPQLPAGVFQLKLRVADEIAKTSADLVMDFRVRGRTIPPSEVFEIQNLRFFRSEQDRMPLDPPAYFQGDAVWGRFEMVGFKLGEKNRFSVEYGLAVFRPSGKLLYEEPKAASEQDAPFYPKLLMQGVLNLNLSKDLSAGEYTIVLIARDALGGQTAELKAVFLVKQR